MILGLDWNASLDLICFVYQFPASGASSSALAIISSTGSDGWGVATQNLACAGRGELHRRPVGLLGLPVHRGAEGLGDHPGRHAHDVRTGIQRDPSPDGRLPGESPRSPLAQPNPPLDDSRNPRLPTPAKFSRRHPEESVGPLGLRVMRAHQIFPRSSLGVPDPKGRESVYGVSLSRSSKVRCLRQRLTVKSRRDRRHLDRPQRGSQIPAGEQSLRKERQ